MKIRFLSYAQHELDDAVEWYNEQLNGLGQQFLDEIDRAIRLINAFPDSSEAMGDGLRRCIVNRFPYCIIYGIDKQVVIIIAVAHLHREPGYWIGR